MMRKRILSFLLAVATMLNCGIVSVFAEDPTVPDNAVSIGDSGPGEICTCTVLCTEDSVDPDCPVCSSAGVDNCLGEETKETNESAECICNTFCTLESVNSECLICRNNIDECKGEGLKDPCICTALCGEESINEKCAICVENIAACKGPTEVLTDEKIICTCDIPCTEENINFSCPVCGVDGADLTACLGKSEDDVTVESWCFVENPDGLVVTEENGGYYVQPELVENGIPLGELAALLPQAIEAQITPADAPKVLDSGVQTVTIGISGWKCENYISTTETAEDGTETTLWPTVGEYTFVAALKEGYAFDTAPQITVRLGAVNLLATDVAEGIWDGSVATSFAGGSGTKDDPYLISNGAELAYLSYLTRNSAGSSNDRYYILTKDIYLNDISNFKNWSSMPPANSWIPIGFLEDRDYYSYRFGGNFDGNGHAIYGVYIALDNSESVGLFGMCDGATVSNLSVEDSFIRGKQYIGGITGSSNNESLFYNCYSNCLIQGERLIGGISGSDDSGVFRYCRNESDITATMGSAGGIVGLSRGEAANYTTGTIEYCYNTGNITGVSGVGGIAGCASYFTNCYNAGIITVSDRTAGGITGTLTAIGKDGHNYVVNCYNAGEIRCSNESLDLEEMKIGALIGNREVRTILENSYFLDTTAEYDFGIGGWYTARKDCALTDEQMRSSENFTGFNFTNTWYINEDSGYPYPQLAFPDETRRYAVLSVVDSETNDPIDGFTVDLDSSSGLTYVEVDGVHYIVGSGNAFLSNVSFEISKDGYITLECLSSELTRSTSIQGASENIISLQKSLDNVRQYAILSVVDSETKEPIDSFSVSLDSLSGLTYVKVDGKHYIVGNGSAFSSNISIEISSDGYESLRYPCAGLIKDTSLTDAKENTIALKKNLDEVRQYAVLTVVDSITNEPIDGFSLKLDGSGGLTYVEVDGNHYIVGDGKAFSSNTMVEISKEGYETYSCFSRELTRNVSLQDASKNIIKLTRPLEETRHYAVITVVDKLTDEPINDFSLSLDISGGLSYIEVDGMHYIVGIGAAFTSNALIEITKPGYKILQFRSDELTRDISLHEIDYTDYNVVYLSPAEGSEESVLGGVDCFSAFMSGLPTLPPDHAKVFMDFFNDPTNPLDGTENTKIYKLITGDVSDYNGDLLQLKADLLMMTTFIRAQNASKIDAHFESAQDAADAMIDLAMTFLPSDGTISDADLEILSEYQGKVEKYVENGIIDLINEKFFYGRYGNSVDKAISEIRAIKGYIGGIASGINTGQDIINGIMTAVYGLKYGSDMTLGSLYNYFNDYISMRPRYDKDDPVFQIMIDAHMLALRENTGWFKPMLAICGVPDWQDVIPYLDAWAEYVCEVEAYISNFDADSERFSHTWNLTITKTYEDGDQIAESICTVCGARTQETLSNSDVGVIEKTVETGINVPEIQLPMSEEALADAVLSNEDKEFIEKGENVEIKLTVEDATNQVSNDEISAIESVLDDYSVGQYLDISLIKIIGDEHKSIVKTDLPIKIVIAIPERLKNTSSNWMRNFAVIRVHNGKSTLLEDKDTSKDTITIETDQFSIYALVYRDEMTNNDNAGNQEDSNEIRNHSSNSLGSNYRDSEQDFWDRVEDRLEDAEPGDTVKANARGYDRMPASVMCALANAKDVTLHITWNGGKDIIIPSGAALNEPNRIYYPLSYLEDIDFTVEETTLTQSPEAVNSNSGNILEVTAPTTNSTVSPTDESGGTDSQQVQTEIHESTEEETEQTTPNTDESEEVMTDANSAENEDGSSDTGVNGFMIAGIAVVLIAAVGGGVWFWKRKSAQ